MTKKEMLNNMITRYNEAYKISKTDFNDDYTRGVAEGKMIAIEDDLKCLGCEPKLVKKYDTFKTSKIKVEE